MKTSLIVSLLVAGLFQLASAQDRIVTAGSSTSEIVCALGKCDNIIATDRTSLYPEKLQNLPSIGYRNGISAEGIIAQRPDLVIFEDNYVREDLIKQLQATNINVVVVANESNLESTRNRIRTIAEALNAKKAGEALIGEISSDLSELAAKVEETQFEPTVLCVYNRGRGNMMVAGTDTPFSIIELAGAKNAVPEISGFKPLNAESLILANPDYILFFESGLESIGGIEAALKITGVEKTTAGKKRQIIALDGVLLTNWGPRIAEAAEQLFQKLHPETQQ